MAVSQSSVPGGITPAQALSIRKAIYSHPEVTQADMELVFQTARKAGPNPCAEWVDLFSESVTDYVVRQNDPSDYISQEKADWLTAMLKQNGVCSAAEFAMLMDVMSSSLGVPPSLSAFALNEIASAIVSGRRGAIGGEDHPAGVVTKADADALRAVLYAATSDSPGHVTEDEAEVLFAIAHATSGAKSDPSFDELFARSIGNYLMAIALHVPSRDEALHREHWLNEREHLSGFFSRIFGAGQSGSFFDVLKTPLELADADMAKLEAKDEKALATSEEITDSEAAWVLKHLTRDGALSSAEIRLLQWLGGEPHALPPQLRDLVAKAKSAKVRAA